MPIKRHLLSAFGLEGQGVKIWCPWRAEVGKGVDSHPGRPYHGLSAALNFYPAPAPELQYRAGGLQPGDTLLGFFLGKLFMMAGKVLPGGLYPDDALN